MSYLKKYNKYRLKQLAGSLATQEDKLLSILTSCAEKKMFTEVKPFINLKRSYQNDKQLLSAMNMMTFFNGKTLLMAKVASVIGIRIVINNGGIYEDNTITVYIDKRVRPNYNIDHIRFLLPCANINAESNDKKTALNLACEGGRMDIIELLVQHGATLNVTERAVRRALVDTVEDNNIPVFRFLMDRGADPNCSVCSNITVLMTASKLGRLDMVRSLVERGANVNTGTGLFLLDYRNIGKSILNYVLSKIDTEPEPQKGIYRNIARCLNDRGADVNNLDDIGMTALMLAIQFEHSDVVEYLCAHGAIVNGKMQLLPPPLPPVQVVPPPMPVIYQPGQAIPEEEDLYA